MVFTFVTTTGIKGHTDARAKKQIRQHASRQMWKSRKRKLCFDSRIPFSVSYAYVEVDSYSESPGQRTIKPDPQYDYDHPQLFHQDIVHTQKHPAYSRRLGSATEEFCHQDRPSPSFYSSNIATDLMLSPLVSRLGAGRLCPFTQYPIEMKSYTRRIIGQMLDSDSPSELRIYKDVFYPLALADATAFCQLLAMYTLESLPYFPGMTSETKSHRGYHALALKSVNDKLSDPTLLSDHGLIATVVGFCRYYRLLQDLPAYTVHFQGLQEIIRQQGGIERALKGKRTLRISVSFVDTTCSYYSDVLPCYPCPHDLLPDLRSDAVNISTLVKSSSVEQISAIWRKKFPHLLDAADILDDLNILTAHLVSERKKTAVWSESLITGLWINPLIHRLLHLQTTEHRDVDDDGKGIQECFRMAALLYMARARWDYGLPCPGQAIVWRLRKLKACLEAMGEVEWEQLWPLKLWVLVLGAINAGFAAGGASPERVWFIDAMMGMVRTLGLVSWQQAEGVVKGLFWIEELMGKDMKVLQADLTVLWFERWSDEAQE